MHVVEYPYPDAPEKYYGSLAELPGFSLLQSTDKMRGRFDIACAMPREVYAFFIGDNPLHFLKKLELARAQDRSNTDTNPPFQSGLIGYFSYEFGYLLQGLPVLHAEKIRASKKPLALFKRYDWALVCDHQEKTLKLYYPPKKNYDIQAFHQFEKQLATANKRLNTSAKPSSVSLGPWNTEQQQLSFACGFKGVQEALHAGRSYQVNLTFRSKAHYTGKPWEIYRALAMRNLVPFAAFLAGEQSVVSFSPERYLQIRQEALLASPIKGTIARGKNPAEDEEYALKLLHCAKNRAENIMITDMWRNDLSRIAKANSVSVPRLFALESYQSVHHLVTDIKAFALQPEALIDNFLACYPAASITGAPKRESMRIIAENETSPRGVYCGSIAYFSDSGCAEGNVAIRTITLGEGLAEIGTGAGILFDSDVSSEFHECVQKIASFWI